jgi:mono/diheme cytochrome c family protein
MVRKPWTIIVVVFAAAAVAGVAIAVHFPDPGISATVAQRQPNVAHGQYVFELADCAACHTKAGGKTLAGGLPLVTPPSTPPTSRRTATPVSADTP